MPEWTPEVVLDEPLVRRLLRQFPDLRAGSVRSIGASREASGAARCGRRASQRRRPAAGRAGTHPGRVPRRPPRPPSPRAVRRSDHGSHRLRRHLSWRSRDRPVDRLRRISGRGPVRAPRGVRSGHPGAGAPSPRAGHCSSLPRSSCGHTTPGCASLPTRPALGWIALPEVEHMTSPRALLRRDNA